MIFFKLPGESSYSTLAGESKMPAVTFVSFDEKQAAAFFGEKTEISPVDMPRFPQSDLKILKNFESESKSRYEQRINRVLQFITHEKLDKLVIARRKIIDYNGREIDIKQSFINISRAYPEAFSYAVRCGEVCMAGAFSELLGKYDKKNEEFSTMSLAGTLPVEESWTEKEINEQKPVTAYIKNILEKFAPKVEISATYDHISGGIKHLRNDFKAKINPENIQKIIDALHPTPAVCGIPKEFCREAISRFEDFPRNFYAGYIRIETQDFIYYFVNLRCAELYKNAAILYAGGGITAQSNPEKEWRETELKADAVLKNLAYF